MEVKVRLFGSMRDKLPKVQGGKATLELAPNVIVQDVLDTLGISEHVIVVVNDEQKRDLDSLLQAGDTVMIFEVAAGG